MSEGSVFSFGGNHCGQLGHGFINKEIDCTPKLIKRLKKEKIIDISYGPQHKTNTFLVGFKIMN
jgi:alpha-tubulin suppressor-like RCC1 family protein